MSGDFGSFSGLEWSSVLQKLRSALNVLVLLASGLFLKSALMRKPFFQKGPFDEVHGEGIGKLTMVRVLDTDQVHLCVLLAKGSQEPLSCSFPSVAFVDPLKKGCGKPDMIRSQAVKEMLAELLNQRFGCGRIKINGDGITALSIVSESIDQKLNVLALLGTDREADDDAAQRKSTGSDDVFEISAMISTDGQDMARVDVKKEAAFFRPEQEIVQHVYRAPQTIETHDIGDAA